MGHTVVVTVFDFRFEVAAPLQAVTDFHHDTSALRKLTPPPGIVQFHSIEPLGEGSVSTFTVWMGPMPLRWEATHSDVGPNGFTDSQTAGPMRRWVHTHRFTPIDDNRTAIHEHVEYEHGTGLRGVQTRVVFSPPALRAMFAWRRFVTKRSLEH